MAQGRVSDVVLSKILRIDIHDRYSKQPHNLGSRARDILGPADIYLENEPTVAGWVKRLAPTRLGARRYIRSLFPPALWIRRYNVRWLIGDVISGITVGMVIVPQAMAYAVLAQLTPAYGLYTSFTGTVLYWVFGTSKDIVIGTTAVGSLLVGQVVGRVSEAAPGQYTPEETAHTLSMMAGAMLLLFGLFRLGWIIEFIPYVPISAFVTAASITIMSTQISVALGIPDINTREAPYRVLANTLRGLPRLRLDAAIGLSSIFVLFAMGRFCTVMERRQPARKRMWSFISSTRLTVTIVLFTIISYIVHRRTALAEVKFRIVGHIERGFQHANISRPSTDLMGYILPELPPVAIVLVIEHIAIAKAMGRLYNYTINPSQEVVALGAANMLSPFVGGYVCAGSFGASAVLSKSGVRTPLAGLFSALVLVLALYSLTEVFYYIPNAALAGLIIHAVVGVSVAVFYSLEWSIYVGIILSIALLLIRLARTKGRFLGLVRSGHTVGERTQSDSLDVSHLTENQRSARALFLPLDRKDASNPEVKIKAPCPGVFVYRLSEGFNYINQAYHVDTLSNYIMDHTRRMSEEQYEKESDRIWNDPGPRLHKCDQPEELPFLRAVVLDFAAVNHVDITAVQGLVDLRDSFDRYSAPDTVEWHFANVHNRWTRRALAVAGFGYPTSQNPEALKRWKPLYSIAPLDEKEDGGVSGRERRRSLDTEMEGGEPARNAKRPRAAESPTEVANRLSMDNETAVGVLSGESRPIAGMASVCPVDRPFFHVGLHEAVEYAVRDAQANDLAI